MGVCPRFVVVLALAMLFGGRAEAQLPIDSRQMCESAMRASPGADPCDQLAADKYDRDRAVPGFGGFCLSRVAQEAVSACTRSVAQFPSTVRFRAQLARALAHAGRFDEARREAHAAAAKGSTMAMVLMGAMIERGLGAPADAAEALRWYRKAADLDDDRAVSLVMQKAGTGTGVDKDSPEAKALIETMIQRQDAKAMAAFSLRHFEAEALARAESGDVRAQHNLAYRLEQEQKYGEAMKWYTRAAEQGFGASQLNVAQMHEKGIGGERNYAEAMKWYRRAAEGGDGEARYRLAVLNEATKNYPEAAKLYRQSVERGDYRAMLRLADMLEQGRGVPKDAAQAYRLYERVSQTSVWAQFKLGLMSHQGAGVKRDDAAAFSWWRKAADRGDPRAQNNIGYMHDRGLGTGVDYGAALKAYLVAQLSGAPEARGNLESFFAEGRGAPADPAARAAWYRHGATAGIAAAQYRLATFYRAGDGVAKDEIEALKWLQHAFSEGYPGIRSELAELYLIVGQKYEKGEGVAPNSHAARQAYYQAALLGDARALERLARQLEAAGDSANAEKIRQQHAMARTIPEPAPRQWPGGLHLDPGEETQSRMQVRVANVGEARAAAVDFELYNVIFWPPIPRR